MTKEQCKDFLGDLTEGAQAPEFNKFIEELGEALPRQAKNIDAISLELSKRQFTNIPTLYMTIAYTYDWIDAAKGAA